MKPNPPAIYVSPQLDELRKLVAVARSRLAELAVEYTKEKSRVDVMQAVLFRILRKHYQKRDRLRLVIDYRKKVLTSRTHRNEEQAAHAKNSYEQAKAQSDEDYEALSASADKKSPLTVEQEAELAQLWKKLVKLYHPDRFADEPEKLETYHKLTAAINRAKDNGDIATLREIAEDPNGFLLRKGWGALDLSDKDESTQLYLLNETLQKEIAAVTESLKQLRESPDYELCHLSEQKPGILDELALERMKQLEAEIAELEEQAEQLAREIKTSTNKNAKTIVGIATNQNRSESSSSRRTVPNLPSRRPSNIGSIIAKLIGAGMLFEALGPRAYDYYTLLRWIVCGVSAYTANQAMLAKKFGWLWIFVILTIVVNPIAPLHLERETWAFVDPAAAVLLLLSIAVLDFPRTSP